MLRALKKLYTVDTGRAATTSNFNARSTITEPNMGELLSSVSAMMYCQVVRDSSNNQGKDSVLPMFCEERYTKREVKEMPSIRVIYSFLKKVFDVGQFHQECAVVLLIYVNRLIGMTGAMLSASNWKPITITALLLAQKVWDDTPLINADFPILYDKLSVKDVNTLERQFLHLLDFKLTVCPSLYAQYYFELRSICEENAQTVSTPKLSPSRQEQSVHLSDVYRKRKAHYKSRTTTLEDLLLPKRPPLLC